MKIFIILLIIENYIKIYYSQQIYNTTSNKKSLYLPFRIENIFPLDRTDKELPDYIETNSYYTEFEVSDPPQKLKMTIDPNSNSFYIISDKINTTAFPNISPFIERDSKTMKCREGVFSMSGEFESGRHCEDQLKFGDQGIANKIDINMADNLLKQSKINTTSGKISVTKQYSSYTNSFLNNLVKTKFLSEYDFSITFDENLKSGFLLFGVKPYEYNSKIYNQSLYEELDAEDSTNLEWSIKIIKIKYNNKILDNDRDSYSMRIDINQWLILGTKNFNNTIYKDLFQPLINAGKCFCNFTKNSFKSRYYYWCNKDADLSSFHNLSFYNVDAQHTFTFYKEDLFINYNNKVLFLVAFDDFLSFDTWVVGSLFVRKFGPINFNVMKKKIGYFRKGEKLNNKKSVLMIILIVLFVVTIIIMGIMIYYLKFLKDKNKKKDAIEFTEEVVAESKLIQ